MSKEPPSSEDPDRPEAQPSSNWIDMELGRRHAAPMFYEDQKPKRKTRMRHSRDYTRASQRTRKQARRRMWGWFAIYLGILIAAVLGFFSGRYSIQKFEQPPAAPLPFESTTLMIKEWNEAFQARAKGDSASALAQFEKISKVEPDAPGIEFFMAESAFKLRDFSKATAYAQAGIQKNNRRDLCQMILGLVAWQQQGSLSVAASDQEAMSLLERAIAMNPSDPYPFYFMGELKREAGDYEDGNKFLLQSANRLDVLDSLIIIHLKSRLASLQARREDVRAGHIPDKIVQMDATQADQRILQSLVLLYQGKSADAAKTLTIARTIFPQELFTVLINDSTFREFQLDPAMQDFYRNH